MTKQDLWTTIIKWVDRLAKPLIIISIILYLVEEELSLRHGWHDSLEAPKIFLWSERIIACLFTVEFFIRWIRSNPTYYGAPTTSYPFNIWGFIDFIAIAPFWAGFFVPAYLLGAVRAMRILRLAKFFRYSRSLQLTALKFYRAYHNLRGLVFSVGIIWLFFAVMCLTLEKEAQPDSFTSLIDAAWFTIVTGTTVGYGDTSPITIWGKIFVGLMLVPIIASIGMAISGFSNACDAVQEAEDDPSIDPLQVWKEEREKAKARAKADRDYYMEE